MDSSSGILTFKAKFHNFIDSSHIIHSLRINGTISTDLHRKSPDKLSNCRISISKLVSFCSTSLKGLLMIWIRRYTMAHWSFCSWFDVNRSIFDEDMRAKNDLYIFVPSDLDLWPLELKFAALVTLVQRCVFTKLEVYIGLTGFGKNRRHGTESTDGQTDGLQHLQ